ncbi:TOMM precursor leader peptide-binding protein [Paenibacillus hodogayensis]|uniref:TOMM leader peptide-binding protein n=1 Tax=Paenibacillus hodogayensis TaxID=279208 RepID=A0ABV5W4M8_9BACL
MKTDVSVIGKGTLADLVRRDLCGDKAPESRSAQMGVLVYDDEHASEYAEAEEQLQLSGIPWLRGIVRSGEGLVGPWVRPGTPGCSLCADTRLLIADSRPGYGQEEMNPDPSGPDLDSLEADSTVESEPSAGLRHVARLLAAEARRVLRGERPRLLERLYAVDLHTLRSSLHTFLPDPSCSLCGTQPDDSAEAARIRLQPRPKAGVGQYRFRPLKDIEAALGQYRDARTGLINAEQADLMAPFASVNMNVPSFAFGNEITAGRSHRYTESYATAALEALERYCGQLPRGKRTVVTDSFNRLGALALDPVRAGLYAQEQYDRPDFPFEPFDPDEPIDWVWGYSFRQERPILVPELLAYYSSGFGGNFVREGSNGCALGGSMEEAILHGILEVAERDAFLMTWYARLPVPRLNPGTAGDPELELMLYKVRAVFGYEVQLFDMTMENGIPAIWALARSAVPGSLNLLCAAGAHLDPARAAKSAVHELAGMLHMLRGAFGEARADAELMYADPSLVQRMEDHVMLYGLPQCEERLDFLLHPARAPKSFQERFGTRPAAAHTDLTDDLRDLLRTFRQLNLEVVVVDQTAPEIARNGLSCVKVLIPGMLPMTFGHHLTRLTGLERLYSVPVRLGYRKKPIAAGQLNPHPHPFL